MTSELVDETNLRNIFLRPSDDLTFRKHLSHLCASYLGGVWANIPSQHIRVTIQRGGSNNQIFLLELPDGIKTECNEPLKVIFRVYRNLTKDHELPEGIVFAILAERRLGPRLLGIMPGGRFEEYIPSRTLTNDEFCLPCVAQEVGRILARIHSLDMPIDKSYRLMHFIDKIQKRLKDSNQWMTSYPMHTTLAKVDKKLCPEYINFNLLLEEIDMCKKCLAKSGSPLVFSNNDVHEGNLLLRNGFKVTSEGFIGQKDNIDPIVLIDYEYACYNYRGFDLCHYCVECCQHNEGEVWPYYKINQEQWPNEEIQRLYVGAYFDEANKIYRESHEAESRNHCILDLPSDRDAAIERLLCEVRQFAAFPQLFWALWSFQQAEIYQIDFDYTEYGFDRLAMYYYWKPEMLKFLSK
ncbi:unnamed protein product [Thelazia callipaeda]|uniref:Choline/ethanolamine kinase n=1 Tax=Thelazia callipaeda TaxID=103827 RepID=A0A0N5CPA6_THECL|nr:unnamed protein product [Thelazia callipaeda]